MHPSSRANASARQRRREREKEAARFTDGDRKFAQMVLEMDVRRGIKLDRERAEYYRSTASWLRTMAALKGEDLNVAGRDYDCCAAMIEENLSQDAAA